MDLKKGTVTAVTTRVKQDGSGEYYLVDLKNEAGVQQPQHLCFDKKVATMKAGDTIMYMSNEKDGKWFMNFPKEKAGFGAGQGGGKRDDAYARINGMVQSHTMPLSYAKDIVIAMINKDMFSTSDNILTKTLEFYNGFRSCILADKALQEALGGKAVSTPTQPTETGLRATLRASVHDFEGSLKTFGWILEPNAISGMLKRLSQLKVDNKLTGGKPTINEMTDAEVQMCFDRFKLFTSRECPGSPTDCKYYKPTEGHDHYCSWTLKCFYLKNTSGKEAR